MVFGFAGVLQSIIGCSLLFQSLCHTSGYTIRSHWACPCLNIESFFSLSPASVPVFFGQCSRVFSLVFSRRPSGRNFPRADHTAVMPEQAAQGPHGSVFISVNQHEWPPSALMVRHFSHGLCKKGSNSQVSKIKSFLSFMLIDCSNMFDLFFLFFFYKSTFTLLFMLFYFGIFQREI